MKLNFILTECTFLRYFIPLIIECNNRNITSTVFVGKSNKYNCPESEENRAVLTSLSEKFRFSLAPLSSIKNLKKEIFFCVEGCGTNKQLYLNNTVHSFTYMTDYISSYENYLKHVHSVIFPSRTFAEKYNKLSDKNLYLGSPKYDYPGEGRKKLLMKYGVSNFEKVALYISPKTRDYSKVEEIKIVNALKENGYKVFCKGRKKDPIKNPEIFDAYFYDKEWFPHTTIDLIEICDVVINFDSTSIKEAILFKKPIINFCVKPPEVKVLDHLYEYSFCHNFKSYNRSCLNNALSEIMSTDYSNDFNLCIKHHMFDVKDTCKRIIDKVLQNGEK